MNETWVSARARSCADARQLRLLVLILSWVSRGGLWKRAVRLAQNARRFVLCGAMFRVGASGPVGRSPRIVVHCARGRLVFAAEIDLPLCLRCVDAKIYSPLSDWHCGSPKSNPSCRFAPLMGHPAAGGSPARDFHRNNFRYYLVGTGPDGRGWGLAGFRIAGAERSQAGFAGG